MREREESRRPKAEPRLHPSGNAAFHKCRLHAERHGLFLLAENNRYPKPLRWTLFDSRTGVELINWFPVTGRWRTGGDSGVCQWPQALQMATSRRDALVQARVAD
jgi:hypothetical protein